MAKSYLTPSEFISKNVNKAPSYLWVFLIVVFLFTTKTNSQTNVDAWSTISIPNTLDTRTATGGETLNFGAGQSTSVMNITVGGTVFQPVPSKLTYFIRRVDNANTNDGVIGDATNLDDFDPWYAEIRPPGFVNANNNYTAPYFATIQDILKSNIIDVGLDNTFNNDANDETSNIERIDVLFDNPVTLAAADLTSGFPIFERNGSGNVAVSVVLSVDGLGNPTSYSNVIINSGYGPHLNGAVNYVYDILSKLESDTDYTLSDSNGSQNIDAVFFSWADFGLTPGTTIYGYSVGAADSPTAPGDFLDYTTFSTITNQADSQGGADLIFNFQYFAPVGDTDGDGITDDVDLDDDGDGLLDTEETNMDIDGDSIPNHLDLDSDGDGIPDNIEAQSTIGFIPPSGLVDANGVDISYSGGLVPQDTDSDGTPDYLDIDSDNEGADDTTEAGLTLSGNVGTNGLDSNVEITDDYSSSIGNFDDSQFNNFPDTDNDVFYGGDVDYRDNIIAVDTDGDGVPDIGDQDDDNDGILDIVEGIIDTDGDGITNNLDLDSDNDGILDIVEFGGVDVDGNGMIDGFVDVDSNGINDTSENPELLVQDNAASINPEINSIGSWIAQNATLTSDITTSADGSYSIKIKSNGISDYERGEYVFNVTNGINYTITIWAKRGISIDAAQRFVVWSGFATSPSVPVTSTAWQPYTFNVTANIDGPATIRAYSAAFVTSAADELFIDKVSIKETLTQTPVDSDGDTIPDFLDLDSDNDGIPDNIEAQVTIGYISPDATYSALGVDTAYPTGLTPIDTDSDGTPDYLDVDSDNEGANDTTEAGLTLSGNVGANGLDDSSETSDGYTDVNGLFDNPQTDLPDTDNDLTFGGDVDYRDDFDDPDSDGDGIPDIGDLDDDNDGIPDLVETGGQDPSIDTDGDHIPFYLDDDDTNAAIGNDNGIIEPGFDFDGDGIPNHLDLDSDNDGLTDLVEADGTDIDGNGILDSFTDTDNDGLDDTLATTPLPVPDSDTDGQADFLDLDSDDDTIYDIVEAGGTDVDNNGVADAFADANANGLDDTIEVTPLPILDKDGDGVPNHLDLDSDNDGILDSTELNVDTDGDGLPNYLDLDSDADGISDIIEAGGVDTDGDAIADGFTDANNNGLDDTVEASPLPVPNTDGDTVADYIDIDSDADGIVDNIEGQLTLGYRTPSGSDDDNDGLDNRYDISGNGSVVPTDTDSDGTPDYIDTDSDDDGDLDVLEGWDTNNNSVIDGAELFPNGNDSDNDGLDNGFDQNSGGWNVTDGQLATNFPDLDTPGGEPDWREPLDIDWDNDGIDDPVDLDDDNDGIPDVDEGGDTLDTDGDGVPNRYDLDSDNDGIYDVFESGQLNGTTVVDLNLDGILDGNPLDFGTNGLLNLIETDDTLLAITTIPVADSDTDGTPDALELNSDGDGCNDVAEAGFTDLNGDGRLGTTGLTTDSNGKVNTPGLTDGYTEPADNDSNGVYDFQEVGEQVTIAVQPTDQVVILNATANFDVTLGNGVNPTYQWYESTDGGISYNALSNGGIYTGTNTATLTINANTLALDGNMYRVVIAAPGYACGGSVTSNSALLTVYPDFDGDGIGDPIDLDDDNDGILDTVEGTGDFDGDGQPNHQDFDADGDGIYDIYESGQTTGIDANGDGMLDGPVGANGVPDSIETAVDSGIINYTIRNTDGDAQPNFLDRDDDGDGVNTINESPDPNGNHNPSDAVNTDGDGRPNYLDIDDDGDGVLTRHEGTANPDGDGRANYLDLDSDGDGIPDNVEGQTTAGYIAPSGTDVDNDGLDDAYDANTSGYANSNGILANTVNSDAGTPWSDASPDYLDLDSDGDTVPDRIEGHDHNFDGLPDVGPSGDSDNDGLDNSYDGTTGYADPNGNVVTTNPATDLPNTDGTGDVNYRDRDDDGDSILTIYENPDPNSDGNFSDSQNSDASTGDIRPDYLDADDDGDGIPTINENPDPNGDGNPSDAQDIDEDGIPDYLDNDDDNDGIATIDEDIDGDGNPANDNSDGDGVPNYLDIDDDNDGILTITEGDNFDDYDLDGYPDYLDLDSDDDGIPDNVESQTTAAYVLPTGVDDDNDGLDNAYDSNDGGYPNSVGITPNNNDGTDNPDYLDTDSDNDSVPDSIEGHDFDANGEADVIASGNDSDGDGLDDAFDGSIGDFADPNGLAVVTNPATDLPNRDGNVPSIYAPITMDAEVDYRDADDDGDGIPTAQEDGDLDGDPTNDDCDEDGTPDYLDYTSCSIVPEAFSPNGDGVNDTLVVPALAQYPNFTMEVYDRWGNIVYEYDNNGRAQPIWWDGYSTGSRTINKGVRVPVGTYFYVIEFNQDRVSPVSGWVYINY